MIEKLIDFFFRRRNYLLIAIIVITGLMAWSARSLKVDNTLRGTSVADSPAYDYYLEFMRQFGDDEFILIVLSNEDTVYDTAVLKSLRRITDELDGLEHVDSVLSLANLAAFRNKDGLLGSAKLMAGSQESPSLVPVDELKKVLAAIPKGDLFLSKDLRSTGILVRIDEQFRFDPKIGDLVRSVRSIVEKNLPPGSSYGVTGHAVVRDAFLRYNLRTAISLSLLATLTGWLVSIYTYKSIKMSFIPLIISTMSLIWAAGLMSLLGICISTATAMAFALVIVVAITAAVHIITHYERHYRNVGSRETAVRLAVGTVIGPALMCTLTTSAGFGSIAVSDLPMIQQLGLIMSIGVLVTYVLALIVCPCLLLVMEPPRRYGEQRQDVLTKVIPRALNLIETHPKWVFGVGVAFQLLMVISISNVHRDVRLTSLFKESVPEIQEIRFIEKKLSPINSLEIVLEGEEGTFARPDVLRMTLALEKNLLQTHGVVQVDSIIPWVQYLSSVLGGENQDPEDPLSDPKIFREYLLVTRLNPDGKRMIGRLANNDLSKLHLSVRIVNSLSTALSKQIDAVRSIAAEALGDKARVGVTGRLAVREDIAGRLVRLQVLSLAMALSTITVLLIIQFRSISFGIVSLIPNIMPVLVVFGIMGWFGIPLDSVTVFAASFSLGLAVDSTIHYLAHLRRAVAAGSTVDESVGIAFRNTARAIMSGAAILVLGFAVLALSPFRSITASGILCSVSMIGATMGDLLFMPSVILTFPLIRRYLAK